MFDFIRNHIVIKTLLAIAACIAIVCTVSGYFFYISYKNKMFSDYYVEVQNIRQIIEGSYAIHMWNIQPESIQSLNETVLSAGQYLAITIFDKGIGELYDVNISTRKILNGEKIFFEHSSSPYVLDNQYIDMSTGFIEYQGVVVGKYELFHTNKHIYEHLYKIIFNIIIVFIAVTIGVTIILFILMNKFVIKKLFSLVDFAKRMANEKKYNKRVAIQGNDEVSVLAKSINEMLEQIELKDSQKDEASKKLAQSESYLKNIFDASPDAIFICEANQGVIIDVNNSASAIFQYDRDELIGKDLGMVSSGEQKYDQQNAYAWLAQARDLGPQRFEWHSKRSNGSFFWTEIDTRFAQIGGKACFIVLAKDITERKRAEQEREKLHTQLLQAQKMEAVGTLAGGVAHDFNNLLQAMSGNIQMLQMSRPEDHPDAPRLKTVENSIERAAELVRQLLIFSRKTEVKREVVDMNQLVRETANVLQRTIPKMIDVELRLAEGLWTLEASPVQVEQVLLNLGNNAAQSMSEGGRLTIETKNVMLDEEFARVTMNAHAGPHVLLCVTDTGCGMDKEVLEHVFTPFFTTKEVGKGTGLGLASVYGIVKAHGGHIQCSSESGQGTTFKIYLPAAEQGEGSMDEDTQEAALQGGSETVLVVDDEPEIRELTQEALEALGYTVKSAASGEEALAFYQEHGQDIDLILLDLNMPGMGGHQCLDGLLQANPSVKVIIASGYTANGHGKDALSSGAAGFIGKPYQLKELAAKVRQVLDESETSGS